MGVREAALNEQERTGIRVPLADWREAGRIEPILGHDLFFREQGDGVPLDRQLFARGSGVGRGQEMVRPAGRIPGDAGPLPLLVCSVSDGGGTGHVSDATAK